MTMFNGDSWMTQQQNQYYNNTAPPSTDQGSMFGDWDMQDFGSAMKGVGSVGSVGLGIANYYQNKKNFDQMMKLRLANFDEQKKAAGLNASMEADRINRHRGGGSSARTNSWFDKVAG